VYNHSANPQQKKRSFLT